MSTVSNQTLGEILMVVAICSLRDDLLNEIVDGVAWDDTTYKDIGISAETIDLVRSGIIQRKTSFQAIHGVKDTFCHPPPCPKTRYLKSVMSHLRGLITFEADKEQGI